MFLKPSFFVILIFLTSGVWASLPEYKVTDQVYMEFKRGDEDLGRVIFGLFGELAPKTVENFKVIASEGIEGKTYANTKILRAVKRFMILGGDILNNDGTGSISIYGEHFNDETFTINHTSAGLLGMANSGPNTNGCQFYVTTMATPWLDGKHVIFGKVLFGHRVVHKIEHMRTDVQDRLKKTVTISKCDIYKINTNMYDTAENYELSFWAWIKAGWLPLSWSFAILAFFHYIILQLDKYEKKIQ
ncbi:unnamed protein product [Brassicogethes aeneus]|uniref:Peptidyl-prolyl cis-trans isomerase n=1 Tax=Brassicogethes aeneus TaxID=1431903 RepID=A0A9P0B8W2_BRAAE|nr:unnamed protein product [Brassicogethes aeneus]